MIKRMLIIAAAISLVAIAKMCHSVEPIVMLVACAAIAFAIAYDR